MGACVFFERETSYVWVIATGSKAMQCESCTSASSETAVIDSRNVVPVTEAERA